MSLENSKNKFLELADKVYYLESVKATLNFKAENEDPNDEHSDCAYPDYSSISSFSYQKKQPFHPKKARIGKSKYKKVMELASKIQYKKNCTLLDYINNRMCTYYESKVSKSRLKYELWNDKKIAQNVVSKIESLSNFMNNDARNDIKEINDKIVANSSTPTISINVGISSSGLLGNMGISHDFKLSGLPFTTQTSNMQEGNITWVIPSKHEFIGKVIATGKLKEFSESRVKPRTKQTAYDFASVRGNYERGEGKYLTDLRELTDVYLTLDKEYKNCSKELTSIANDIKEVAGLIKKQDRKSEKKYKSLSDDKTFQRKFNIRSAKIYLAGAIEDGNEKMAEKMMKDLKGYKYKKWKEYAKKIASKLGKTITITKGGKVKSIMKKVKTTTDDPVKPTNPKITSSKKTNQSIAKITSSKKTNQSIAIVASAGAFGSAGKPRIIGSNVSGNKQTGLGPDSNADLKNNRISEIVSEHNNRINELETRRNDDKRIVNEKATEEINAISESNPDAENKISLIEEKRKNELAEIDTAYNNSIEAEKREMNTRIDVAKKELGIKNTTGAESLSSYEEVATTASEVENSNDNFANAVSEKKEAIQEYAAAQKEAAAAAQEEAEVASGTAVEETSAPVENNNVEQSNVRHASNTESYNNSYSDSDSYSSSDSSYSDVSSDDVVDSTPSADTTPSVPADSDSTIDSGLDTSIDTDNDMAASTVIESTPTKKSSGGSVIPAVLGVGAAGAATVAGVRYVKNKKQNEDMDEDYDDENNDSGESDSSSDSEYMKDDYLGPAGGEYTDTTNYESTAAEDVKPDENNYVDPDALKDEDDFEEDEVMNELN